MDVTPIKCPACCDKSFESKTELIEHLASLVANITCPICTSKCSSYDQLIGHLTLDNCQHITTDHTVLFDIQPTKNDLDESNIENSNHIEQFSSEHYETQQDDVVDSLIGAPKLNGTDDETEIGKMYVELLSKQMAKPCLQTQEMKLMKDNGVSRYFIMTHEDSDISDSTTVVTKQNIDGTISLTTVEDMKTEADTVIMPQSDAEDPQDGLYSCNTCGVSFSSVLEHIQNYHNDQDVVVEDQMEESAEGGCAGLEDAAGAGQAPAEAAAEKPPRRVITDTGAIVETPFASIQLISNKPGAKQLATETGANDEVVHDKDGRVYTRRYLHIDNFHDSFVKSINKPQAADIKNGRYHKVIQKEIKSADGSGVKVYNCLTCGIFVTALDEFQQHPCKKDGHYKCSQCNISYNNPKSLCAHMKAHKGKTTTTTTESEPESKVTYECSVCSTEFPTNKSLKLHKRMHDPIKARPIEPPVENTHVFSTDKYVCSVCSKVIPVDYRTVHENSHKDIEQFNCDICNKKFSAYEYLEMHLNVHSTEKIIIHRQDKSSLPYTCSYCDRRFARPHEKVKHERIHTGEKPHSCEICGKSFRVSYCLTLHMRTHTGARPYACPHCGKRFKAHSVYNHHLLTHSEVRAYKCPYCPKAFKTSVQLAGHKNSHTKPFSCQHCNRPFASLYAVRAHTETHARQNNLKFACPICGAKYARAFALKDHVKQAHGGQEADSVVDNIVNGSTITLKDNDWIVPSVDEPEMEEMPIVPDKIGQLEQKVLL